MIFVTCTRDNGLMIVNRNKLIKYNILNRSYSAQLWGDVVYRETQRHKYNVNSAPPPDSDITNKTSTRWRGGGTGKKKKNHILLSSYRYIKYPLFYYIFLSRPRDCLPRFHRSISTVINCYIYIYITFVMRSNYTSNPAPEFTAIWHLKKKVAKYK